MPGQFKATRENAGLTSTMKRHSFPLKRRSVAEIPRSDFILAMTVRKVVDVSLPQTGPRYSWATFELRIKNTGMDEVNQLSPDPRTNGLSLNLLAFPPQSLGYLPRAKPNSESAGGRDAKQRNAADPTPLPCSSEIISWQ